MLNWLLGRSPEKSTPTASPADAQRYVDSVADLPRPSVQQITQFVEYVSTVHSWYKHLPLIPPERPFVFYLDPNAGREWIEDGSRSGFRDRAVDTQRYIACFTGSTLVGPLSPLSFDGSKPQLFAAIGFLVIGLSHLGQPKAWVGFYQASVS